MQKNTNGYQGTLTLVDGSHQYGADITPLQITVTQETVSRLHVKIQDPNNARWTVPGVVNDTLPNNPVQDPAYTFSYTTYPFGFAVSRAATGEVLFNSSVPSDNGFNPLVFEDQYLSWSTVLPSSSNIYGLGEHIRPMKLDSRTYTLWNRDQGTPEDMNLYGSHPFYMDLRVASGTAHGVFLLSSNGMDVIYKQGNNYDSLQYNVIGGIIDLYFFLGPTPEQVVQQYVELVGRPYFPPYWSLGFHNCRWGYPNISTVEGVVQSYRAANIPLETMWTDIDYMDSYRDFSFDPVNFPPAQMAAWVDSMHANYQHYVPITDPGISNTDPMYLPLVQGTEQNVWIRAANGSYLEGRVWPGDVYFPDWFHPNASSYWQQMIAAFHQVAAFDGLWIDMNEISNFCDGSCAEPVKHAKRPFGTFDPNNPPYQIANPGQLQSKTISMDAQHHNTIEYNVHNMFGFMEGWLTQEALEAVRGKRAFVVSRSTFPGSGSHNFHWTGDVSSTWGDLYLSIPDVLTFNMLGIPMVGADICGFNGDTTMELCARWIELGAFYPFSRDHNAIGQISQELYRWPEVAAASQVALGIRYTLLPYYYTLFYEAYVGIGATVARPLFFEFPSDAFTATLDQQFLVGSGIMITPVLTQGATTVSGYMPAGVWYDWYTHMPIVGPKHVTLDAPLEKINVHVRGGAIIPIQDPSYTTTESRANPFNLIVALDSSGDAAGSLFVDDGDSLFNEAATTYVQYSATASSSGGKLANAVQRSGYQPPSTATLGIVYVLGLPARPSQVSVNGQTTSSFTWNSVSQSLTVTVSSSNIAVTDNLSVTWQ